MSSNDQPDLFKFIKIKLNIQGGFDQSMPIKVVPLYNLFHYAFTYIQWIAMSKAENPLCVLNQTKYVQVQQDNVSGFV